MRTCSCCGKEGHMKAECPMKDKQCDLCGMIGHLRVTCRQGVPDPVNVERATPDNACHCCGKLGHRKADCPAKDKQCALCGQFGHLRSTCRQDVPMSHEPPPMTTCSCCGK